MDNICCGQMTKSNVCIFVEKLTDISMLQRACSFTIGKDSKASLSKLYDCEHSPIRTQMFWIEMKDIPTFVAVHFSRHKVGVEHYILTKRDDRGGDKKEDRYTPINHAMFLNAQSLINMARKRLCKGAHWQTVEVMQGIKDCIKLVDPDLYLYLVPECIYRGNVCHELKSCGLCKKKELT